MRVACHLDEALIDFHVPKVGKTANDRGSRVCVEGCFESLLRFILLRDITSDQNKAVRFTGTFRNDKAADAVDPFLISFSGAFHLDGDIVEALAGNHPLDGVLAAAERMVVTIA